MFTPRKKALTLHFLGSGNGFSPGRAYSSFLLDRTILFEASPTSLPTLQRLAIPVERIRYILISHFHADHCFGLPFFFLHRYFQSRRPTPLTLIGPRGLKSLAHRLMDLAFPETRKKHGHHFPVTFLEVRPGKEYVLEDLSLRVFRMSHGNVTALGYGIHYKQRRLAYSGDTGRCPGLEGLLRGAEIAVVEMSSLNDDYPFHLNRKDVLDIRKTLPQPSRVILTHLPFLTERQKNALLRNPYGSLELAEDLKRFPSL